MSYKDVSTDEIESSGAAAQNVTHASRLSLINVKTPSVICAEDLTPKGAFLAFAYTEGSAQCAQNVLNSTSPQLTQAYSSQSSLFA
jgi:hypothetical protein